MSHVGACLDIVLIGVIQNNPTTIIIFNIIFLFEIYFKLVERNVDPAGSNAVILRTIAKSIALIALSQPDCYIVSSDK